MQRRWELSIRDAGDHRSRRRASGRRRLVDRRCDRRPDRPDPELERPRTDEELAQARPFVEADPELAASILRDRPDLGEAMERAQKARAAEARDRRQQVSIRLDPDVLAKLKATGPGWQRGSTTSCARRWADAYLVASRNRYPSS